MILDNKYLDELFDKYLKALKSKNARLIYTIMFETDKTYLTTLDLQYKLKKYNTHLNKKELNNWLNFLRDSKLVTKKLERGRPTTINYDEKYTFDLWRISKKGKKIGIILPLFNYALSENSFLEVEDIIKSLGIKQIDDGKKFINLYYKDLLSVFNGLNKEKIYLSDLKIALKVDDKSLINKIRNLRALNDQFLVNISKKDISLKDKLLKIFGIFNNEEFIISLKKK